MDTKGLQLEFISWCKSKKKSPKTEEETKQLFHAFMKEKHPKEYEAAMKQQQLQETLKAAHGTKLQYIKNLKHQCANDEELYYYKKGGSVGCGCKKKEDGGEVVKAGVGVTLAVNAFKASRKRKAEEAKKKNTWGATSKIVGKDYERGQEDAGPKSKVLDSAVRDRKDNPENIIKKEEKKKHSNYYTSMAFEKGNKIVKKFKAKCGSKMKKHQLGGSLNGIPFMLEGTPKGGVLYKPDWYKSISAKSGVMDDKGNYFESFGKKSLQGDRFNRLISTYWSNNPIESDTIYLYFPKKGQSIVAHSKFPQESSLYNKLKENFLKIISIPSGRHYFDL